MSLIGKGTFSADGNGSSIAHDGGDVFVGLSGSFGSGTVTLEVSDDNGLTYYPIVDSEKTAADGYIADLPNECLIRMSLSGSTSPSITWTMATDPAERN